MVGKFYPPHVGHLALVTAAAESCERVSVVVAGASHESISLGDRVAWLGWGVAHLPRVAVVGMVDEHRIDYDDAEVWDAHTAVFRAGAAELCPHVPVDSVFTGEDYGDELARRFDAVHVRIGRDTVSGTAIRADIAGHWRDLVEPARADLACRVVVVGAECTGTTTLASGIGDHYGTGFVAEYGRIYTAAKLAAARQKGGADLWMDQLIWDSDEFTLIAARQNAAIDQAASQAPLVIADTDALATSVWHDRYVGGLHQPALAMAALHPADLYLLTACDDIPFLQDGLRDGEHIRRLMTAAFREALERSGRPWLEISGPPAQRLARSIAAVDESLRSHPPFAKPARR